MGEWSEYFEDFPEENLANHKQEPNLGPMSIVFPHLHLSQLTKEELAKENSKISEINAEIARKALEIENTIVLAKRTPVAAVDDCPICYGNTMNVFMVSENSFYCECSNCNSSGVGTSPKSIYQDIEDKVWTNDS